MLHLLWLDRLEKKKLMLDRIIESFKTRVAQQQKALDELREENAYYDTLIANAEVATA